MTRPKKKVRLAAPSPPPAAEDAAVAVAAPAAAASASVVCSALPPPGRLHSQLQRLVAEHEAASGGPIVPSAAPAGQAAHKRPTLVIPATTPHGGNGLFTGRSSVHTPGSALFQPPPSASANATSASAAVTAFGLSPFAPSSPYASRFNFGSVSGGGPSSGRIRVRHTTRHPTPTGSPSSSSLALRAASSTPVGSVDAAPHSPPLVPVRTSNMSALFGDEADADADGEGDARPDQSPPQVHSSPSISQTHQFQSLDFEMNMGDDSQQQHVFHASHLSLAIPQDDEDDAREIMQDIDYTPLQTSEQGTFFEGLFNQPAPTPSSAAMTLFAPLGSPTRLSHGLASTTAASSHAFLFPPGLTPRFQRDPSQSELDDLTLSSRSVPPSPTRYADAATFGALPALPSPGARVVVTPAHATDASSFMYHPSSRAGASHYPQHLLHSPAVHMPSSATASSGTPLHPFSSFSFSPVTGTATATRAARARRLQRGAALALAIPPTPASTSTRDRPAMAVLASPANHLMQMHHQHHQLGLQVVEERDEPSGARRPAFLPDFLGSPAHPRRPTLQVQTFDDHAQPSIIVEEEHPMEPSLQEEVQPTQPEPEFTQQTIESTQHHVGEADSLVQLSSAPLTLAIVVDAGLTASSADETAALDYTSAIRGQPAATIDPKPMASNPFAKPLPKFIGTRQPSVMSVTSVDAPALASLGVLSTAAVVASSLPNSIPLASTVATSAVAMSSTVHANHAAVSAIPVTRALSTTTAPVPAMAASLPMRSSSAATAPPSVVHAALAVSSTQAATPALAQSHNQPFIPQARTVLSSAKETVPATVVPASSTSVPLAASTVVAAAAPTVVANTTSIPTPTPAQATPAASMNSTAAAAVVPVAAGVVRSALDAPNAATPVIAQSVLHASVVSTVPMQARSYVATATTGAATPGVTLAPAGATTLASTTEAPAPANVPVVAASFTGAVAEAMDVSAAGVPAPTPVRKRGSRSARGHANSNELKTAPTIPPMLIAEVFASLLPAGFFSTPSHPSSQAPVAAVVMPPLMGVPSRAKRAHSPTSEDDDDPETTRPLDVRSDVAALRACVLIPNEECKTMVVEGVQFLADRFPQLQVESGEASNSRGSALPSIAPEMVEGAPFTEARTALLEHLGSLYPTELPILLYRVAQHALYAHAHGWRQYQRGFTRPPAVPRVTSALSSCSEHASSLKAARAEKEDRLNVARRRFLLMAERSLAEAAQAHAAAQLSTRLPPAWAAAPSLAPTMSACGADWSLARTHQPSCVAPAGTALSR